MLAGPGDMVTAPPSTRPAWSIRRLLVIGIVALEIVTVGALVFATYLGARGALAGSYQSLARQVAGDAVAHARDLLGTASAAVAMTRNAIEDGALDTTDQQRLAQFLFEALKDDRELAGLYFGSPAGDFVYVMREHAGADDLFRIKTIRVEGRERAEAVALRDRHWGLVRDLPPQPDDFQPTSRPWYQKALEIGGDGWTAPYSFYTSTHPGISFARSLTGRDGQVRGVVGGDIELDDLAAYIAALRVGPHGRAMIATRADGPDGRLAPLAPTGDPALMQALGQVNGSAHGGVLDLPDLYRFDVDGMRHFAITAPFATADLPWLLLIAVPESDYLGWFYAAERSILFVGIAIGLAGILAGLLFWRGLAAPLERLRQNALAVQRGRWDELHPIDSQLAEVRETEAAFGSMARFLIEQQTANHDLVRRLRKLAAVVEQSPAAVFITDATGCFEYVNPAFAALTRYAADAVIGQPALILARGPEDHATYEEIVRGLALGQIWRGDNPVRRADGSVFEASFVVAPVRNGAGLVGNSVGILDDITQARAHQRAIAAALDVAVTANQARAEFLAHMSHDLRTPLNAILGFSDVLRSELFGPLGDARYRAYADDIWASGDYLLRIVSQILEIARAESASLTLIEDEVAPVDLVETARRLMTDQATARAIAIEIAVPRALRIRVDPTKMHQIVVNLVSNAVKFTPEGGRIDITTRVGTDGIELRVADTGIGMTPQQIGLALQPFIRVDNDPMARKTDGVGLGLPIAQRLVQLHGGTLSFDSRPGIGTTVIVRLPADRVVAPVTEPHITAL
jgi:PAS domain S-box-containing protein